jgi:glutamate/tyrosine decarboxylase-like PLP-dependent enzyme
VCLQAGNIHSGAFDPVAECVEIVHRYGGWVHVDGAFGLWAAASPSLRQRVPGLEQADSWATDAHKTLNVPYDSGLAIVADRAAVRGAMGLHASYLIRDEAGDPFEKVPELSRRARGVPVWAALRSLGRQGVTDLVDRLALRARQLADGLGQVPGATVVNDVVFTQVSVSFGDDETTRAVTAELLRDGTAWMSGSVWRGQAVLRVSVSNWSTDEADVATSVDAVARASARVRTGGAP